MNKTKTNTAKRRFGMLVALAALVMAFAAPAAQADNYVALGDSYASGTGSGGTTLNSSCVRTTNAYPYKISQQRAGTSLSFVACSGATTSSLMSSQISSVTSAANVISVQIGGNDIGFSDMIISCSIGWTCSSAISEARYEIQNILPGRLDTVYSAIKARAPLAKVAVVGYPRMYGSSGCWAAYGITSSERTALNGVADLLRDTIRARALAHGLNYADAIPPFAGHDVCSSSRWINGFSFSSSAYHPNSTGHASGYTPLVRSIIG